MLFRRVSQHLYEQNWTAVVIDFAIVVVGVFIGIQVSNWNESRGERAAEAGYLVALESDARFSMESIESVIVRMRQAQDARRSLYEFSVNTNAELSTHEVNRFLQGGLFNIQRLNVRQVAFDALTGSGQLSIIGDSELASELQALDTAIEAARELEDESANFTYNYLDPYLLTEADTENLVAVDLFGNAATLEWVRGNGGQGLSSEQLRSLQFKNLLLYQAEISRTRLNLTEACLRQYQKVLDLILARQAELET